MADLSKDYRLPGAGTRRSSRIGRKSRRPSADEEEKRSNKKQNELVSKKNTAPKDKDDPVENPLKKDTKENDKPIRRVSTKDLLVAQYEDLEVVEKVQYYFIVLAMCGIPFLIYGFAFTQIGYGIQLLTALKENAFLSTFTIGGGMLLLFILYLFDFSYWKGCWKIVKNLLLGLTMLSVNVGIWTMASSRPQLPLFIFYLFVPAYFAICKQLFLNNLHESHFLAAVSQTYFTAGIVSLVWWIVWTSEYASTWTAARLKLNDRLYCTPNIQYEISSKSYSYCSKPGPLCKISSDYRDCIGLKTAPYYDKEIFGLRFNKSACEVWSPLDKKDTACQLGSLLLYFSMLGTAFVAWFFGCISLTLSYVLAGVKKSSNRLMKIFGFLLIVCFTGFYLASALNMANSGLADILMTFSIFGCFAACGFLAASLGWRSLEQDLKKNKGLAAMGKYDSMKGWLVLFFGWAYLIFYLISLINQCFRKSIPCAYDFTIDGKGMEAEKEKKLSTTLIFYNLNQRIKKWNHTAVLVWVQIWAILYFLGNIFIGKVVYVTLSMLSDWMQSNLPFFAVCICFYFVGLFMFLNPAIPGVPVYLVGGVVITRVGERVGFGFINSCILVCGICFVLKLCAVAVQQKLFGEMMAEKRVWIRALIGINSPTTRAIKKILMVPGLNLPKIVILCGGPDWPTSVTTGILKCSLPQMLLGTLPIMFLIIPTVMTGAFKNKEQDGPMYQTLSGIFMASTSVVQGGAMLLAGYYIQQARTKHFEELSKPDENFDKEVDELDKLSAAKAVIYKKVTQWEILPGGVKANLLIGTFLSVVYTYFFAMGTTISPNLKTFKAFELSDSVATKLDGNPFSIVETWGAIGLIVVTLAVISYKVHTTMAKGLVEKYLAENGEDEEKGSNEKGDEVAKG